MSLNLTYAIEIQYEDEGYVSDEEASEIDYDEMLKNMQKSAMINPQQI